MGKHEKQLEARFEKFEKCLDDHQGQLFGLKADIRSLQHQVAALT